MKLLVSLILIFSLPTMAESTDEMAKLLKDNNCTPIRAADGTVTSFRCVTQPKNTQQPTTTTTTTVTEKVQVTNRKSVKLVMAVDLNGQNVSKPEIVAPINQTATLTQSHSNKQKELVVEVLPAIATLNGQEGVLLKFKIGQKDKGDGKPVTWISSPMVLAQNNHEVTVTVGSNTGEYKDLMLKVTPTLQ